MMDWTIRADGILCEDGDTITVFNGAGDVTVYGDSAKAASEDDMPSNVKMAFERLAAASR